MKRNNEGTRSYFGTIFGLVFVFAGLAVVYMTAGRMTIAYFESYNWHSVPATILELDLEWGRESDSNTVTGSYAYQYSGREYVGTNITTSSGSDNFGSFWQDLYNSLDQRRRYDSARVWVNPDQPSESIMDRSFRWSVIGFASVFLVLFCGLGGTVAWASWSKHVPERNQQRRVLAKGGIASNEKSGGWFLLGFGAIFFFVGAVMGAMILPEELAKENYPALLVLVFAIAGAGIMFTAARSLLAYRRFGPTPLHLDPPEPGTGGQLGAYFHLPSVDSNGAQQVNIETQLRCIREYRSGDDTKTRTLWSSDQVGYALVDASGLKVITIFTVPDNARPSDDSSSRDTIYWEVSAKADFSDQKMGKFQRSWRVYVGENTQQLKTGLTVPELVRTQKESASVEVALDAALSQIRLTDSNGLLLLHSAAGRGILTNLMGLVFGAIFAGAGWFTINQDWWPGYLFLLVGGGIGLACVFSVGSSVSATFDRLSGSLTVTRRWMGLPFSTKRCSLADATQFSLKQTMSTGNGNHRVEYFDLCTRDGGGKFKVAERIKGRRAAEALKQTLVERLF